MRTWRRIRSARQSRGWWLLSGLSCDDIAARMSWDGIVSIEAPKRTAIVDTAADGSRAELPLNELAKMLIFQAVGLAQVGKHGMLDRIAAWMSMKAENEVKRKRVAVKGGRARKRLGDERAAKVLEALAKGTEPPASERHVRRIRNREADKA
jgi:hypothetical protein